MRCLRQVYYLLLIYLLLGCNKNVAESNELINSNVVATLAISCVSLNWTLSVPLLCMNPPLMSKLRKTKQ